MCSALEKCRESTLLEQVLTLQSARRVALMKRQDALEMGTTDSHDQFHILNST
ncbi:hypothetical protein DPMN_160194 [Dreissena polymorpha]|uniref:Uncharacterized protein n=1 Tax=Dreissena polymorpha TaxID=45954 RepID=A0A9D4EMD4_DREPO|nr:hypothetical protein DPMN_160194 [Dreissena polymorpha]